MEWGKPFLYQWFHLRFVVRIQGVPWLNQPGFKHLTFHILHHSQKTKCSGKARRPSPSRRSYRIFHIAPFTIYKKPNVLGRHAGLPLHVVPFRISHLTFHTIYHLQKTKCSGKARRPSPSYRSISHFTFHISHFTPFTIHYSPFTIHHPIQD